MAKNGLYTGYVLPNSGINPVQVWVPDIDGWFALGSTRTIGYNMLNGIGSKELDKMRKKCGYYYLTQELNSGNYRYNEAMGGGTTEEYLRDEDMSEQLPDLTKGDYRYRHNGRANQKSFTSMQSDPLSWMLGFFSLDWVFGHVPNAGANYPTGDFVKMDRWQRVVVAFLDGGTTGIILRVLPWTDDYKFVVNSYNRND